MKPHKPFQLTPGSRRIILALGEGLIEEPQDLKITDRDSLLITRCEMMLREFPVVLRLGFILCLHFFNHMTFLFGVGIRRFIHLSLPKKRLYVSRWKHCRFTCIRELFKSIRGFVLVNYFSHRDVWRYIGYDPVRHAQEKKALRQKLTEQP